MKNILIILFLFTYLVSCNRNLKIEKKDPESITRTVERQIETIKIDSIEPKVVKISLNDLNDSLFVNLKEFSEDFVYDLKYATSDNFLKAVVYDCAECFFRVSAVKALIAVNKEFIGKGYRIQFFDCYRPHDVQKKMWKIMPNRIYVADPAKGSVHNKGGAADLTLVDMEGNELDMGTSFDYFGRQAHHAYQGHSAEVLKNRKLLKETMEKHGFGSITSEWWHYNHKGTLGNKVANFKWKCNEN